MKVKANGQPYTIVFKDPTQQAEYEDLLEKRVHWKRAKGIIHRYWKRKRKNIHSKWKRNSKNLTEE